MSDAASRTSRGTVFGALLCALAAFCPTSGRAQALEEERPPDVVLPSAPEPAPPSLLTLVPDASSPAVWPSSVPPPGPSVGPVRVHDVDVGLLVGGSVLIAAGWGGAIAWSAHYFANLPVGVASCNDAYAGVNLIPVIGPPIAIGALAGCASVRFTEWLVPVLTSAVQIPGLVLLALGAVGADDIAYRDWGLDLDLATDHAALTLHGSF